MLIKKCYFKIPKTWFSEFICRFYGITSSHPGGALPSPKSASSEHRAGVGTALLEEKHLLNGTSAVTNNDSNAGGSAARGGIGPARPVLAGGDTRAAAMLGRVRAGATRKAVPMPEAAGPPRCRTQTRPLRLRSAVTQHGAGPGRSSAPEGTGERGREGRASGCRSVTLPGGGGRCRAVPAAEARRDGVRRGGKERGGGRRRGWGCRGPNGCLSPSGRRGSSGASPFSSGGPGLCEGRAAACPRPGPGGGAASGCGARCGSTRWWCWAAGGWGSPP